MNRPENTTYLADLLEQVVDCTTHHGNGDETFIECHACGEWDGHVTGCPVEAAEKWLAMVEATTPVVTAVR